MTSPFVVRRLVALCLLTAATGALAQTELSKDSPFIGTGAAAAAAGPAENYEFAGVSTIAQKTSVNIYDRQAKRGRWIAIGDTVGGIKVKTYDARRDQVVVTIDGTEKVLTLRKAGTASNAPVAAAAPMPSGFNVAAPAPVPTPAPVDAAPVTAPALPQPPPPAPGTVAHQEQEARMLVSDLLEIGMAQRKAYEEAQKRAGDQSAGMQPAPATPPSGAAPTPPAGKP